MSGLKPNCFDIFYPQINNSSIICYNNFDKISESSITIGKNDSESNQGESSDDFLPNKEQKIFSNNKSSHIAYNPFANSLKKTNDNTKKITKTKIEKDTTQNPQKKKRGRPKTKNKKKRIHTKKSKDNLRCKIKFLLLKSIREYINTKIDNKYKFGGKHFGQLLIIKKNEKESICFYRKFFQKTIREIFSEDITNRYRNENCSKDHNKKLIEKLLNDDDEEKRKFYNELFDLKLINCLQHFRSYAKYYLLEGLKKFKEIKYELKKKGEDDNYIEKLKISLDELEDELILKNNELLFNYFES